MKKATEKKAASTKKPVQPATPVHAKPGPQLVKGDGEKHIHVLALQSENIKRISFVRIRPKGRMVQIAGPNGSGKTSILDSLSWALTGERQLPSQPIRKGQNSAKISVDLGDLKVERTFTRVHGGKEPFLTRLTVYGKNREAYPTPQSVIDRLRGVISFDPLAFIQMKPDKQLEALQNLLTFDIDLPALDEEKAQVYQARREEGRNVDSAKARLKAIPAPLADLPTTPIDTKPIEKKIGDANTANQKRLDAQTRKRELENQAQAHRDRTAQLQQQAAGLRRQAEEIDKLATAENQRGLDAEKEEAKIKVPEGVDAKATLAELSKANETNNSIQKAAQYRSVAAEVQTAEEKWANYDRAHKQLEADRAAAIERAKMPIEKLGIGEGEVLYDGLPLSQASNGEQIRVSVALAMASNPQLRVLRIMDGSLLDKKTLDLIEGMAEEHDFQVWVEQVEARGKVGVVMEDGEATGEDVEAVK